MADKKVEVGVKLKLEQTDAAASEIDKLRKRVLELEGATQKTETGFLDLAKQAAAMTLAVNIMPAIHQMVEWGKSLIDAGLEADAADKSIGGLITTVQGLPWDQSRQQATGFREDMEDIAIAAGVATKDVQAGFQAMTEMRGASAQALADSTRSIEQMSTIASVLHKSVEGISREYSFMSEGVLRTRGQMFQLLQTTGIFGNDTKKAASYWSSLTEESRIKALDYGLAKVATSMGKVPPLAEDSLSSIEDLWEVMKGRLGETLLHELAPVLIDVKNRMQAMVPTIERIAHQIGPEIAKWVGAATQKIEEGFKYLETHEKEIHDAIVSAYDHAKSVIDFIIANKDMIAIAFGAKTAIPAAIGAAKGLGSAYGGFKSFGQLAATAGAGSATAVTVASMAAFAAAVAVFATAAYFLGKHIQESKEHVETQTSTLEAIHKVAETGDVARVEKLSSTFKQMAMEADGELNPALQAALEHIHSIAETSQRMKAADVGDIDKEIALAVQKMKDLPAVTAAQVGAGQTQQAAQAYADNVAQNQAALLIDAYSQAARTGNMATAAMAAQTIAGSELLRDAFLKSSESVEGGLEKFADVVIAGGSQFAGFAAAIRGKGAAKVPAAPVVHMSGGQTFKITQDFREQDPDKIALIFERDIVKLAENRIQARTTIPFGG